MSFHCHLLSLLFLITTAQSSVDPTPNQEPPICIVGAGISGISTALLLQSKGHHVSLFEEDPIVGGKMLTYRQKDGVQVEMGALLYSQSHDSFQNLIKEYQMTPIPYNLSDVYGLDIQSGQLGPLESLPAEKQAALQEAAQRYLVERAKHENQLKFEYPEVVPSLFYPMSEWLESNKLEQLKPVFWFLLTSQGYGALEDTPALYGLKLVDRSLLETKMNGGFFYRIAEGMDVLAERMAGKVKHLYLNHIVTRVHRHTAKTVKGQEELTHNLQPNIHVFNVETSKSDSIKCKRVVLAFPPTFRNVDGLVHGLTTEEADILDQIKIHKYTSAANIVPGLDHGGYIPARGSSVGTNGEQLMQVVEPRGAGEVVGLARQSPRGDKDVYSSYSWVRGSYDRSPGFFELLNIEMQLKGTLRKINRDSKTLHRETFDYFPHVNTQSLQHGFYKKFQGIQGQGGLFYATTVNDFECLEGSLEMTEAFVEKYF